MIVESTKSVAKHLGFLLNQDKLQLFGLNGKCCTDNLYTNYVMDMFPISGDLQRNSFTPTQVSGEYFKKTIDNFVFNSTGG